MNIFNNIKEVISVGRLPVNSLINADCLQAMKYIEDKSIDMVLCDPPYGTTACKWDVIIPFESLWKQYRRIIKDNGAIILTSSQPFTSALVMSNINNYKHSWVWNKKFAGNFVTAKYAPMKVHEDVLVFCFGSINYFPKMIPRYKKIKNGANKCSSESAKFSGNSRKEDFKKNIRYKISRKYFIIS